VQGELYASAALAGTAVVVLGHLLAVAHRRPPAREPRRGRSEGIDYLPGPICFMNVTRS
jgi:hypothetical protein